MMMTSTSLGGSWDSEVVGVGLLLIRVWAVRMPRSRMAIRVMGCFSGRAIGVALRKGSNWWVY